jgi:1,4-dihydroxy-2-naphthoyl-CoA synthase
VLYEVRDRVAWVTINRPEARNALNKAARHGIRDAFVRFNGDDDAAVAVLTGTGDKVLPSTSRGGWCRRPHPVRDGADDRSQYGSSVA